MKTKKLYHIIFERFYQSFHRGWGGLDEEDTLWGGTLIASCFLAIVHGILLAAIYVYLSIIIYGKFIDSIIFYPLGLIGLPINIIYFFYKKRYVVILNQVKINRTKRQKRKHTLIALGFVLFTFAFFIIGLCLMGC